MNKRDDIITNIWDCDLVEYRPEKGFWKIPCYNRDNEFVYLTSKQYYEAKDLYEADKKIQAIKILRNDGGLRLIEAKQMYENTFILAKKVDKKGD